MKTCFPLSIELINFEWVLYKLLPQIIARYIVYLRKSCPGASWCQYGTHNLPKGLNIGEVSSVLSGDIFQRMKAAVCTQLGNSKLPSSEVFTLALHALWQRIICGLISERVK